MPSRPRSGATPGLDIRLIGPPEVLVAGRPLDVDTRKAVAILAMLAADGRAYARDELAAILWPESDDAAARGALRRTLSTLRHAVGDGPLVIERDRVALDGRHVRVDVQDVEAAARATDRPTLERAATLARGAFLAGFNLRDSPEFDDWRATRAVGVERSVLIVLDRLAAAAHADGDLPAAIEAGSRRLDLDPLDETGHVRLMDLLAAAGDRSGALRQYRACVAILERELGVPPLAATTARYEAIRDGLADPVDPDPAPVPGGTDLRATLPLVGRGPVIAAITAAHAAARSGTGRVVVITGEAGIGKTRVATEAVAALRAAGSVALTVTAYPAERSIAYGPIVELFRAALGLPDVAVRLDRLPSSTRTELGRLLPAIDDRRAPAPSGDGPGAHARLVAAIADGLASLVDGPAPGVIWIDDVQWLDAASHEALSFLVRRIGGRRLLLGFAWRPEDLDADGQAFVERIVALQQQTTVIGLERLGRADIEALVASSMGSAAPDRDFVDRLASASEGLPLYVVEALASGAGEDSGSLPAGVRAVLRERLMTTGETASQVIAAASVIGRSFDLATVRHASGRSEDEAVDALDEALRRGLIREVDGGFDFAHGALRDLAYDATSLARRRLLHRRVAEALRLDLAGSGRDDLGRLALVAWHEQAAGRASEAAEAFRIAGERAADIFANREAIDLFESAIASGHPDRVGMHTTMGRLRTRLGDYAGAVADLETAAAIAPRDQIPVLELALARAHLRRGDLAAAAHHLDAASDGAATDALLARIWVDRSVLLRRAGDPAAAAQAARRALLVAERAGDTIAVGAAHRTLGLAALDAGAAADAVTELGLAVKTAERDPDPTARIAALAGLAMAEAATGAVDQAMTHGRAAADACRLIGDRHLEAAVENHLADILHAAGRDDEAMGHLRRAVEAFAEVSGDRTDPAARADPDPGIWMLSAS